MGASCILSDSTSLLDISPARMCLKYKCCFSDNSPNLPEASAKKVLSCLRTRNGNSLVGFLSLNILRTFQIGTVLQYLILRLHLQKKNLWPHIKEPLVPFLKSFVAENLHFRTVSSNTDPSKPT
ncbi:hypothetical protein AVEN_188518-1 [Araneus ventricosus]|uniref:Uncharacterized protein n=1 Tax=Araneus ventricosus TaxID=182803 RepID=A0A4Y2U0U6_ARAVE|nr:hypothetical protein AVEN_188518-1 [Araneus ventricosus]